MAEWWQAAHSSVQFSSVLVLLLQVDGKEWDLFRPLEGDCQMELCDFEHKDGKHVGDSRLCNTFQNFVSSSHAWQSR